LVGGYAANSWVGAVATTGIILGAAYMLWLYWRIAYGSARTAEAAAMPDLSLRELAILAPIAAAVLWMGVYPESFMAPMRDDVTILLARIQDSAPDGDADLTLGAAPAPAHGAHR
jgi:NADH-quinone oxidoreductase subunit M